MRIRTIKPEFWTNEELSSISPEAALLAVGILNYADDEGYFNANPRLIQSQIFPLRDLSLSIHGLITELSNIGYIELSEPVNGKQYGRVVTFQTHQRVNRPKASTIAPLFKITEGSVIDHGSVTEGSLGKGREGKGREVSIGDTPPPIRAGKNSGPKKFKKPTIDQLVQAFKDQKKNKVADPQLEANKFFDYYESKGG